jgi:glutamine synthetase
MFEECEDVRRFIEERAIRMVDLKFVDLWGGWHHVTVPASQFDEVLYEEGVGFDGSSVGFRVVNSGDMVLRPELATGALDPFYELPTLGFICTTLEADTKAPFPQDPRNTAARAEAYLRGTGIADRSLWGPEFEFYVFDRVTFENGMNQASYRVDSGEAEWSAANGGRGHVIPLHGGYHAMPPADRLSDLRSEIALHCEAMGVPVTYHHHEVGGPGQVELEIGLAGPVAAGDHGMTVKYVSKMVADRRGQTATFMPKPLFGEAGSGMHFHQHLFRDGVNLFYDAEGYGLLSETARFYIGGLLLHAPALLGLTNPSTNSYRRLVPGFEAPVRTFFSLANRSAAVRVPKYATRPDTVRIEFRPPDATGNLYLSMAAQLMAGIDGIRRRIDPAEHGFGPIDDNVFALTPEQAARIGQLPVSLDAALQALEDDHAFLLEGDVFSEDLIQRWVRTKRDRDVQAIRTRPHPYEVKLYFDT